MREMSPHHGGRRAVGGRGAFFSCHASLRARRHEQELSTQRRRLDALINRSAKTPKQCEILPLIAFACARPPQQSPSDETLVNYP